MTINKKFVWIGVLCFFNVKASAQQFRSEQGQADSLQRITMRDSLHMRDESITQVFFIRDEMYNEIKKIRKNPSLTHQQKEDRVKAIRSQTNQSIKILLGEPTYWQYVKMVMDKLRIRKLLGDKYPLAGEIHQKGQ